MRQRSTTERIVTLSKGHYGSFPSWERVVGSRDHRSGKEPRTEPGCIMRVNAVYDELRQVAYDGPGTASDGENP